MSLQIKCTSCNGDVTHAKIETMFTEYKGAPFIELKLKCPQCGEQYTTLAEAFDLVNDNSDGLQIFDNNIAG